ncbi:adenylate kinase family enzyme [Humitalea rosea]|uniref:Adenylate kinase family enzyme n=1 Tax=Humitalea rosea TaxID=990373 RepID=A0A2W7J0C8_9PROT|nr:adenylate kinase [Humitalea rosea]PZW45071.1 adenylate kinase family enzyme [Humitalea rosea]
MRCLIIGNSGAGKSWLAARLGGPVTGLDDIHWEPGGYDRARDKDTAIAMVRAAAAAESWVIEGVFGWLAREAMPRATRLVWLDLSVADCLANLHRRGARGAPESFEALLAWAADYPWREGSSARGGHARLLAECRAETCVLRSRAEVDAFLSPTLG